MTTERIKIGFVGAGNMGQCAHLRNYATIEGCEVAAIAEIRPELARKVAAKHGVPKVYGDFREMLEKERLDGIVASQPFRRHGVLVPELLKAGIPVFTEKPIAASVEVGARIAEAVRGSGTWLMVGYHKRSDPATMRARKEIERLKKTGELGRLKYVRITMPAGDWIAGGFNDLIKSDESYPALESDPPAPDMDENTWNEYTRFVNYYIHQVNLMRHLLCEPYKVTHADPSGVLLAGESESGAACMIEMTPYQTTIGWHESALVCFEKGFINLELPAPLACNRSGRVTVFSDPGGAAPTTLVPTMPWEHAMRRQAMNFLAAIRGEMEPLTGAEEAIEDLKLAREYIKLWKGK